MSETNAIVIFGASGGAALVVGQGANGDVERVVTR